MEPTRIATAIKGAFVKRGPNTGRLLASCPKSTTDAAAAWQAIQATANPFKLGIGVLMFFSDDQREIYKSIDDTITSQGLDVRALDRDRAALEKLGAW